MRRQKLGCKTAAAILAATIVISGMPAAAVDTYAAENDMVAEEDAVVITDEIVEEEAAPDKEAVNPEEEAVTDSDTVNQVDETILEVSAADDKFNEDGSLKDGTYTLPISMKNASKHENDSMAASCVNGPATLEVKDGVSTVTMNVQPVSVFGITGWASKWTVYPANSIADSTNVIEADTHKDADGNVDQVIFRLPGTNADGAYQWGGAYLGMYVQVMDMNTQGWFAMDFANAILQNTEPAEPSYGSEGTKLAAGTYDLPVSLMNASDITSPSMAAAVVQGAVLTVAEDKTAKITIKLTSLTMMGMTVWAKDWKIYQTADKSDTPVDAQAHTNEEGNVDSITFTVPDNSWDGVYMNMNSGRASDAYLAFNYAGATVYTEPTPSPEPSETPKPTETPKPADPSVPTQDVSTPAIPSGVKAASTAYNKVKLTWEKASGADGYQVYQYRSNTKKYKLVKTVVGTSYTKGSLKTGTRYRFKVRSYRTVDGKKIYSSFSKVVSAKAIPSRVKGLKAANTKTRTANISWKKVSGASGYVLYCATGKNGTYKKVATVKKGSKVNYSNRKLSAGKTYYYKVRAYRTVKGRKVYSKYSKIVSVKIRK